MSLLSSRVRLLDASQLSEVEARLHALSVRLAHIAEKKKATEDADKQTKVRSSVRVCLAGRLAGRLSVYVSVPSSVRPPSTIQSVQSASVSPSLVSH